MAIGQCLKDAALIETDDGTEGIENPIPPVPATPESRLPKDEVVDAAVSLYALIHVATGQCNHLRSL